MKIFLYFQALNQFPDVITGHTNLSSNVKPLQGVGIEFFLGFILVLCVYGVCDSNKPDSRFIAPLAIGMTVTLGHLGTVHLTGSSMNPARTFGTAVVYNVWENHWVSDIKNSIKLETYHFIDQRI